MHLRSTFAAAIAELSTDQTRMFERATGTPVAALLDKVLALDDSTLARVLDLGDRGMRGGHGENREGERGDGGAGGLEHGDGSFRGRA